MRSTIEQERSSSRRYAVHDLLDGDLGPLAQSHPNPPACPLSQKLTLDWVVCKGRREGDVVPLLLPRGGGHSVPGRGAGVACGGGSRGCCMGGGGRCIGGGGGGGSMGVNFGATLVL